MFSCTVYIRKVTDACSYRPSYNSVYGTYVVWPKFSLADYFLLLFLSQWLTQIHPVWARHKSKASWPWSYYDCLEQRYYKVSIDIFLSHSIEIRQVENLDILLWMPYVQSNASSGECLHIQNLTDYCTESHSTFYSHHAISMRPSTNNYWKSRWGINNIIWRT